MRVEEGSKRGIRGSALWGKGSKGEQRSSALWGKGGRAFVAVLALVAALVAPTTASAHGGGYHAYVPAYLLERATANPGKKFAVIVQGKRGETSGEVAEEVLEEAEQVGGGSLKRKFRSIAGAAGTIPGAALLALAHDSDIRAITLDARMQPSAYVNAEMWRESTRVDQLWHTIDPLTGLIAGPAPQAPAIAIVDSGVDASKLEDFGTRVVASVNVSSTSTPVLADDQGHGTMVAGVAAGASPASPGVAQNAPIVSVRTADANGMSVTSDVVAAVDWILNNKGTYGIRVANFSLSGSLQTTFRYDPLNAAVERLWFAGVVVVAAAGNHGTGTGEVDMSYSPGNDPFIITVGALDPVGTADPLDDAAPWWTGFGYTVDGFSKPDVAAPGRYMVMPVPLGSSIPTALPDRIVAPGYMWMSGTSFAAPIVAGAAAQILARHPEWTPDEVKGALMVTAAPLVNAASWEGGVGEIDAAYAASLDLAPNPNENFAPFIATDSTTGQKYFDEAAWSRYVTDVDPYWTQAAWSSAAWSRAAWSRAAWSSAAWSRAEFNTDAVLSSSTISTVTTAE